MHLIYYNVFKSGEVYISPDKRLYIQRYTEHECLPDIEHPTDNPCTFKPHYGIVYIYIYNVHGIFICRDLSNNI